MPYLHHSHHFVQEMAAFSVEEYKSHKFRIMKYNDMITFEVINAEKLVTIHADPKFSARNFYLTIRVQNGSKCSVHETHIVFYPNTQVKMIVSREISEHHPGCLSFERVDGSTSSPLS